jgi:hypothetical protein
VREDVLRETLEFLHCRVAMIDRMRESALPENAEILRAMKVDVESEIAVRVEELNSEGKSGLRLIWNRVLGS